MGQATPFKPIALVVEDDELQREMVAMLLEESEMGVIQCESAEAALLVLDKMGGCISMMFADVNLAGQIDGIELAHAAKNRYPNMHVIVTSGTTHKMKLPEGAAFMQKPWLPLDVLREAQRSQHH
jgi:DNA-binding NtrC family response regulator